MDVRCESCQTIYEFDDARVKEGGVNVKCTQCGHVFKVEPRSPSPRPRTLTGLRPVGEPIPPPRSVTLTPALSPPSGGPASGRAVREDTGPQRVWMLRSPGSTEVRRFRDLTTLQMWIVEGKAGPDDVLSRNGDRWQRIGSIGELEPFFRVVAQAAAAARAGAPAYRDSRGAHVDDTAWRATEPQLPVTPAQGKTPVVVPAVTTARHGVIDEQAAPEPFPDPPAASEPFGGAGDDADVLEDELPRGGPSRRTLFAAAAVATVLAVAGGYGLLHTRAAAQRSQTGADAQRLRATWSQARAAFLLDSDEDLAAAESELQKARAAAPGESLPLAALVELESTRARYLRDDAAGPNPPAAIAASDALERAQVSLSAARRYLAEVTPAERADPLLQRATADLLLIEGAQAAQVEEALTRAESQRADDPEARYVRGLLALREGRASEGRALLEQANLLSRSQTQRELLRAKYRLAEQLASAGEKEDARGLARAIVADNPRHARAARLLARLGPDAAVAAGAVVAAPATAATPGPTAPSPTTAPGTAAAAPTAPIASGAVPSAPADVRSPRSYAALCAAGNRLLENGRGREAVKLFEKALSDNPHGVEAESGLGWALLDTEHYNAAADKFKQVLADMPGNGEAIIGLAETYKLRGDHRHALEWYKRYVADLPRGPKAAMAQANVRELEDEAVRKERPAASELRDAPPLPVAPTAAGQ